MDARNPGGKVRIVEPRRSEVEYFVEHHDGFLYILTNSGLSPNYRLVRCPVSTPGSDHWEVNLILSFNELQSWWHCFGCTIFAHNMYRDFTYLYPAQQYWLLSL